jgi:O-antigen/teichoic acid export membrane protein
MEKTSRTEYAARNIVFGYIGSTISILLTFVSRTVFMKTIGLAYLGVNGLFTNVLGVLSFTELGVGTAMNYALYRPVAENDTDKVRSLMQFYKTAYRVISVVVLVLGLLLLPFLPYLVKGGEGLGDLRVYYLFFLFNTSTSYLVTYKYGLVNAEQKGYIITNIDSVCKVIIALIQIVALVLTKSFLAYLAVQSVVQLLQKIYTFLYIDKKYPFLTQKNPPPLPLEEKKQISRNVRALMLHKLGEISISQSGNIIISSFISVVTVGIVSNYNLILTSVALFINIIANSMTAGLGNVIATESREKQYLLFRVYHFLGFFVYGFASVCLVALFQPFMAMWAGAENRIDMLSASLLVANFYLTGQRNTIINFKMAGGLFAKDRLIPLTQAGINLLLSLVLVHFIGLPGVFIAMTFSGLVANIWRPLAIYPVLFGISGVVYLKEALVYAVTTAAAAVAVLGLWQLFAGPGILRFLLLAILAAAVPTVLFCVLFRKDASFLYLVERIKSLVLSRIKRRREGE